MQREQKEPHKRLLDIKVSQRVAHFLFFFLGLGTFQRDHLSERASRGSVARTARSFIKII